MLKETGNLRDSVVEGLSSAMEQAHQTMFFIFIFSFLYQSLFHGQFQRSTIGFPLFFDPSFPDLPASELQPS